MTVLLGGGAVLAVLLTALVAVVWSLISSTKVRGVDPDWLKQFSVSSYRPMERLLDEDDIAFLKSQPGFEPGMDQDLRSQRRKVFRMYLRNLGRDFNRLHYALRLTVLHSPQDNPELAKTLIKQKVLFFVGFLAVRIKLEAYALGVGTVDVRGLVATLDTMRTELNSMLASPVPSPAAS
jgi:hypothetical protein